MSRREQENEEISLTSLQQSDPDLAPQSETVRLSAEVCTPPFLFCFSWKKTPSIHPSKKMDGWKKNSILQFTQKHDFLEAP